MLEKLHILLVVCIPTCGPRGKGSSLLQLQQNIDRVGNPTLAESGRGRTVSFPWETQSNMTKHQV